MPQVWQSPTISRGARWKTVIHNEHCRMRRAARSKPGGEIEPLDDRSMTILTYGNGLSCELDSDRMVYLRAAREGELTEAEIVAQVRRALAEPLEYPPLTQASVPGDRVVIAISAGMPMPLAIVEGALAALRDAGIEISLASVLVPCTFVREAALREMLNNLDAENCPLVLHDPDDPSSTAMFGVTKTGQALRLNRQLCDADLVLSFGVASEDARRSFNGLFPEFSDRETIDRLEAPLAEDDQELREERCKEIAEAGWMFGLGMIVQVVPGPGGSVLEVVAGDPKKVSAVGERRRREVWSSPSSHSADLVIATLVGDSAEQSWKNLGRALSAASALLGEGGSVAICSEISELPGRASEYLAGSEDYQLAEREILRDGSSDSWAVWQLCRALERGPVYLRSQLPVGVVESLGIVPITSDEELERLAQAHDHAIVLEEAQRLLPSISNQ
ncbi:MAG: lactate racemase domain-containing protein [Pirellulales bacterium]|nr:lactate racemase domain-containing protein [Pirellulales bacterium]